MEEKTTSRRTSARKAPASDSVASQPTPSKTTTRKTAAVGAERKAPAKKAAPVLSESASPIAGEPQAEAGADAPAANMPSPEERYRMTESAAYFIAEKDGFRNCSTHYWALAEQEVAQRLGEAAS